MSTKLFVGNLSDETTNDELRTLFGEVGVVASCDLAIDRATDRPKGFGFIEMNSREAAQAAKEKFNGQALHGHALKVEEINPQNDNRNDDGRHGGTRLF